MNQADNPVVALTLTFQDGSQRKHQFGIPVPQELALRRLSREIRLLKDEPEWDPATNPEQILQLFPKLDKYLTWWRLEQESINLFRFLAYDHTEIWMIEEEHLDHLIENVMIRLKDYEEAPHDE